MSKSKFGKSKKITPDVIGGHSARIPQNTLGEGNGRTALSISVSMTVEKLLRRSEGANIEELVQATGWRGASLRALISREIKKKQSLPVWSEIIAGVRIYRIINR